MFFWRIIVTMYLTSRILYSALFFVLSMILLFVWKPAVAFDEHKRLKPFGVAEGNSVFSMGVITIALAMTSYILFCLMEIIS